MSNSGHIELLIKKRMRSHLVTMASVDKDSEKLLVAKSGLVDLMRFLHHDPDAAMELLLDISCVEHAPQSQTCRWQPNVDHPILEVFYLLRSARLGYRLSVSVLLDDTDPSLPSLSTVFLSAVWLERELWDMFGVYTEGHPGLRRLMMYTAFSGHPMRRSYPISKEQALVPIYHRAKNPQTTR